MIVQLLGFGLTVHRFHSIQAGDLASQGLAFAGLEGTNEVPLYILRELKTLVRKTLSSCANNLNVQFRPFGSALERSFRQTRGGPSRTKPECRRRACTLRQPQGLLGSGPVIPWQSGCGFHYRTLLVPKTLIPSNEERSLWQSAQQSNRLKRTLTE